MIPKTKLMKHKELIQKTLAKLQAEGFKSTLARRATIEALVEASDHLTAPQVVSFVHQQHPHVGRASVYRTLELMSKLGLLQVSSLGAATTTYLLSEEGHHHHVICVNCRKTVEFDECVISELEQKLAKEFDFQIEGHLVELYGRCSNCRQ